ncbi:MAG: Lytic transglycosylase catalytic [Solirubrobacterales bacterium]|nr:Lytic transglycosylase catalytic [Solirubrobacterales bacterium]
MRAGALLVLAIVTGGGLAAVLLRQSGGGNADGGRNPSALLPGATSGQGMDPLRYTPALRADREARAAAGLAHVLYAKSPGGAVATAQRVAALRPKVERAAKAGDVDPNVLEGIVFLESAGRPDAQAGRDLSGAAGLTQILAETATNLLGMKVDVAASTRLTRGIARGHKVAARVRQRRRVDERFDPDKALAATVKYLGIARRDLHGDAELAIVGYHMGIGNLQTALSRYGAKDIPYAQLFFGTSPVDHRRAYAFLAGLGDDSSTYLWRVRAAESIMRQYRADPAALAVVANLQTNKNSAEEVLHPEGSVPEYADPFALGRAEAARTLIALDRTSLARYGIQISPSMGELAPRLKQSKRLYRALRPEALAVLQYLGAAAQGISGSAPLIVTSTIRDRPYQHLLTASNIQATKKYSLHTTGYTFDIARRYVSSAQAKAFQFALDRLTALNLIAWVREPAAIHVTVSSQARELLPLLAAGAPAPAPVLSPPVP